MPYITSVEQIGMEKGERSLVLRQLERKFGELPDLTLQQINALSTRKLGSLGEALLDFATIDDLQAWLKSHKSRRSTKS
jgi:heme oxygenase